VSFKEMISLDVMQKSAYEIPLALGKDILGEAQVIDLVQDPAPSHRGGHQLGQRACW